MKIAQGKTIDVVAPTGGLKKDKPVVYGVLLVVPNMTVSKGQTVSCTWHGLYDGPLKVGDSLTFTGEPAYFDGSDFTKTQPDDSTAGNITTPVGAFIDGGVLLTGELVTPVAKSDS
ncbi:MAG: hypothetical protein CENE_03805 [Candidatus Celerinatantimonas neptuna]|nr:MAG: hypothetical protein CENE_03805 [Candidatus Celerinatantimonas neptuna]